METGTTGQPMPTAEPDVAPVEDEKAPSLHWRLDRRK
jgi:hypothetical protein